MIFFPFFISNSFSVYNSISEYLNIYSFDKNITYLNDSTIILNLSGSYNLSIIKDCIVEIKLWGAGGGGTLGGYGGFSKGNINFKENDFYIIWVGEGGNRTNNVGGLTSRFGGGGYIGKTGHKDCWVGTGGGLSGIFINSVSHSNSIIIAGGGGGSRTGASGVDSYGGSGGGNIGGTGENPDNSAKPGTGGTQTNGGNPGGSGGISGSELLGGGSGPTLSGSGGGGGFYGGGGGNNVNYCGGPGGGGSGYIESSKIINGSTSIFQTDFDYIEPYGKSGNGGLILIRFLSSNLSFTPKIQFINNFLIIFFINIIFVM